MAAVTSIIAAGTTLASTGMSIAQASKQNRLAKDASKAADAAFKKAEAQLDVNYFEELGISKTPYDNQREAIAQSAAQAMEVGKESERGGAATAGRVLAQSNVAQQGITDNQTKDLETLQKLVATEEASLGTAKSDLSLAQAEGAGIASAEAQNASNAAVQSAVSGVADFGMGMYENSELYGKNAPNLKEQQASISGTNFTPEQFAQFGNVQGNQILGENGSGGFTNLDFNAIGDMSRRDFRQFRKDLSPEQQQMLNLNPFKVY